MYYIIDYNDCFIDIYSETESSELRVILNIINNLVVIEKEKNWQPCIS